MPAIFLLFILIFLPASLFAQGAPAVTTTPAPASTISPEDQTVLQFPNAQISDILDAYERLTGKHVLRDSNIAVTLSINAPAPLTKAQAIQMIEGSLLLNGFVFIAVDNDTVKLINTAGNKMPRSEGVALFTDQLKIPNGEIVVSFFLPLKHISPAEALEILNQHIQLHIYGSMVAVPNAQALLITENASLIHHILNIMPLIDIAPSQLSNQFITLSRANADRVATIVTNLLQRRATSNTSTSTNANAQQRQQQQQQPQANRPAAAASSSTSEPDLISGDALLVADTRTNRILVITRPSNFPYIKELVEQFDAGSDVSDPYERPLKYIAAAEVLPVLKDLLTELDANTAQTRQTTTPATTQTSNFNSGGTASGSSGNRSVSTGTDVLKDPTGDLSPTSLVIGNTRLVADKRANSIFVMGPPESIEKVRNLLDRLDTRPMQVYLSTVIGQLTLSDGLETGVDLLQHYANNGEFGVASGLRTRGSDGADTVPSPASLISASSFPLPAGLTIYGQLSKSIDAYVKLLSNTTRFKILSRPSVYTSNNKKAVILSGQSIAVPGTSLSDITGNNTTAVTTTIEYLQVVLKLEVIPLINANKEVTLDIAQQNNTVVGSVVISGNSIPTVGTQQVRTSITVPNKTTIVLGGLITTQDNITESGVPILKDIPYLGLLFKNKTTDLQRQELIVLIQPTVVENQDDAAEFTNDRTRSMKLGVPAQEAIHDEQVLPAEPVAIKKHVP